MLKQLVSVRRVRGRARASGLGWGAAILSIWCATDAYAQADVPAQEAQEAQPSVTDAGVEELNEIYRGIERRSEAARRDVPLTTRFLLNGRRLDAQARPSASLGLLYGSDRKNEPIADIVVPLTTEVESSSDNGVGLRRQTGWYVGLRAVDETRTVEWRRRVPVELIGFDLDVSVTGGCLVPGIPSGDLCTFTPGITVQEDDIDPETLVPSRFRFDSDFGDRISPETHQALKDSPGFVRGAPDLDERVGISLQVPNAGQVLDESRRGLSDIDRKERAVRRPIVTVSRVEQTLRSTDTHASLDHTTRGLVLLKRDEWDAYSAGAQIAAWLLPGMNGDLPLGDGGLPEGNISNNLFLAANNLRLPRDGFTMFRTGSGRVTHPETAPRNPDETPAVFYNSVWLGASPVRSVSRSMTRSLRATGDRNIVESRFRQGGIGDPLEDITGRITIVDEIANEINALELQNIDDVFFQTGIGISRQDAVQEFVERQRSSFEYVPHLSFTGNRTDGRSVLRYYGGVLDPSDPNFYIGADGTYQFDNGVRVSGSMVYYTEPDFDYYNNVELSIARSFNTGSLGAVTLGVAGELQFDRPSLIPGTTDVGSVGDRVELFGQYQADWGRVSGRVQTRDGRNSGRQSSLTLGATFPVFERAQMSVQVTPLSDEDAYVLGRVGLNLPLTRENGGPVLRAQYARLNYELGSDAFGQKQDTTEDTMSMVLQLEF